MYYGNSAAISLSNATSTFVFFDDFVDPALTGWSQLGSGTVVQGGTCVTVAGAAEDSIVFYSNQTFGANVRLMFLASHSESGSSSAGSDGGFATSDYASRILVSTTNSALSVYNRFITRDTGTNIITMTHASDSATHVYTITRTPTVASATVATYFAATNSSTTQIPSGNLPVIFQGYHTGSAIIDWCAVTKWYGEVSQGTWSLPQIQE
jgi:hypothetical protein